MSDIEELRKEISAIWDVINKILDKLPKTDNPYLPKDYGGDNGKGIKGMFPL